MFSVALSLNGVQIPLSAIAHGTQTECQTIVDRLAVINPPNGKAMFAVFNQYGAQVEREAAAEICLVD